MKDLAEEEGILSHVRNMINQNKVRLWETPFYDGNKVDEDEMLKLSLNLAPSSEISQDKILDSLYQLQSNALDKLASRQVLKDSGLTKLKLKTPKTFSKSNLLSSIEIEANKTTGNDLRNQISSLMNEKPESIKLISGGKVLGDEVLGHLTPGSSVMILPIDSQNENLRLVMEQNEILQSSKHDAELLKDDDRLQIGDQSGKSLDLPLEEKKALIMAMSLHEKAKVSLKKKDFSLALVFLLEAHKEFQNCSPTILSAVDNYGLLNLDIAWCYLNLQQLNELPQAEQRLSESEICFNKIYGKDLERHKHAKILLSRLHLLKGVIAYHKGDLSRARCIFNAVKEEFKSLYIPEELIEELVALGYGEREARLALRICDKNVPHAASHIDEKRKERKKIMKEEKRRDKKRKALGKTSDGKSYVNLGYFNTMKSMGFPENLIGLALRQSNNDMGAAIDMIQNEPEVLLLADEENKSKKQKKVSSSVSDDDIAQIVSMGFDDLEAVRKVLLEENGNVEKAIESLTRQQSKEEEGAGSSPASNQEADSDEAEATQEFFERKKRSDEAYSRMKDELGNTEEEDYLDLTLEEENQILERYIGYLLH